MYSPGEVIRCAREQRGWGQRRLAEVSGVAQPNVAAIEAGTRTPSLAMVARLVNACGLQLRFDLEPRHADTDAAIRGLWQRPPQARLDTDGRDALLTASRLAGAGARLVVDGPLAARLLGAPVRETTERIWCDHTDLPGLRRAATRCYLDARPMRVRYDDDGRLDLRDGDKLRISAATVTLGPLPAGVRTVDLFAVPLPVADLDHLLAYPEWSPADRIAVRRLEHLINGPDAPAAGDIAP